MHTVDRRHFLGLIGLGTSALLIPHCHRTEKKKLLSKNAQKPNIVFIMADDMGYGDPGCYNPESKTPTPNIDQLAAEGIRFTNAHSSGASCIPARYGLLTGRYPFRVDLNKQKFTSLIDPGRITIASILKKHGYHTACIGKWHLGFNEGRNTDCNTPLHGGPIDHGFDYFFGMHASLDIPPYFYIENDHCVAAPTQIIEERHSPGVKPIQGAFWRRGKIAPNFKHEEVLPKFTHKAINFIEQHQKDSPEQPFFLYFALPAPHTPWLPLDQFKGKSKAGDYGDFVVQVDDAIGQVLQTINRLGLKDNTLVFFTSDNGPVWFDEDIKKYNHRSADGLRGMKIDAWEGGHRMPFIARWPGKIKPGTVSDETICFTDMLATFAAIMGDTLPENAGEDSYNILPVLLGQKHKTPLREATVIENRVIIQGDWKLIFGSGMGGLTRRYATNINKEQAPKTKGELYNLKDDLSEKRNLYDEHPEIVERLTKLMEKYQRQNRSAPMM